MKPVRKSVEALAKLLNDDFGLTPIVGVELEFYLPGILTSLTQEEVISSLKQLSVEKRIPLHNVEAERGFEQFEIIFRHTADLKDLALQINGFKQMIIERFAPYNVKPELSAKPFTDQPGSGLHVHIHLADVNGINQFTRMGDAMEDAFSKPLLHSLGGLLVLMNPCMLWFSPYETSYNRFSAKSNAPLTVSWGTNNRTVALRLPAKPLHDKHIEHRVAGSDASVDDVLWAVLAGIHLGLKSKLNPGDPIYGDASLAQYRLPTLARSLAEAQLYCERCNDIVAYLQS